jgi:hypothetical protein
MFKKRGQGQSWSLDIILALIVFVLIIGIFYALLGQSKKDKTEDLTLESRTIVNNLDSANSVNSTLTVIDKGTVDADKINKLYNASYDTIKKQFGIKGDFCIYMIDQYGNILTVNTTRGEFVGFGNGNFSINGMPCGQTVS